MTMTSPAETLEKLSAETKKIGASIAKWEGIRSGIPEQRNAVALRSKRGDRAAIDLLNSLALDEAKASVEIETSKAALAELDVERKAALARQRAEYHREMVRSAKQFAARATELSFEGDRCLDRLVEILVERDNLIARIRSLAVVTSDHGVMKLEANHIGLEYAILGRLLPHLGGLVDGGRISSDERRLRLGPFTESRMAPVEMLDPDDADE